MIGDPGADGPAPEVGRAVLDDVSRELDGVSRALERLDDGTYGRCEECGAPVPDADLAADPLAGRCPAHRPG